MKTYLFSLGAGLLDLADVYALSGLPAGLAGADAGHLLLLSEESGRIVEIGRDGAVFGSLALDVAGQHEGLTMDDRGWLYVVGSGLTAFAFTFPLFLAMRERRLTRVARAAS